MRSFRHRLTYSNVIATLALFIALGGGAYAALKLPANSVGTKQIKDKAVTAKKLGPSAVALLRAGPAGPQGIKGEAGAKGDPGAGGSQGPAGDKGPAGPGAARILLRGATSAPTATLPRTALFTLKGLTMYASCDYGSDSGTNKSVNMTADIPAGSSLYYTFKKTDNGGTTTVTDGAPGPQTNSSVNTHSYLGMIYGDGHLYYDNGTDTVVASLSYLSTDNRCIIHGSAVPASP
jgi:hypothetical protein